MADILKFPYYCKKPETCREAFFEKDGIIFVLCEIKPEEMDELLKDKKRSRAIAYPYYFDRLGRHWPEKHYKINYR